MLARITVRVVGQAQATAKQSSRELYVWDTDLRGFGLRVSPKGNVSWLIQRWFGGRGGKAVRYVLDRSPPMSLEQARRQAEIDIGEMRKGTNLVDKRRQLRKQIKATLNGATLEEAFDSYLRAKNGTEPHRGKLRSVASDFHRSASPTNNRYWTDLERTFRRDVFPTLGSNTLLSTITKPDIRQLIETKQQQGYYTGASNLFSALRPFFSWCVEQDYLARSPLADLTAPKPPAARDRVLAKDEIRPVWQACETLGYPWGHLYKLLLLTAQRRDEVAGLMWSELDLDNSIWTIPSERTKNKRAHIVHLSSPALGVLGSIPRQQSPFVFTTTLRSPISGYSKAKAELDRLSGVRDWVIHDIRRTVVSHMAELGIATDVADRILNHISGSQAGVKGIYQRYEFLQERKEALERWGKYIFEISSC